MDWLIVLDIEVLRSCGLMDDKVKERHVEWVGWQKSASAIRFLQASL